MQRVCEGTLPGYMAGQGVHDEPAPRCCTIPGIPLPTPHHSVAAAATKLPIVLQQGHRREERVSSAKRAWCAFGSPCVAQYHLNQFHCVPWHTALKINPRGQAIDKWRPHALTHTHTHTLGA